MDNDNNPSVQGEWRDLINEVKEFIDDIAWHDSHYSMSKRLSQLLSQTNDNDNQLPPAPVAEELSNESPAWWVISKGDFTQDQEVVRRAAKFGHVWEPLYKSSQTAVPDVEALAQMLWEKDLVYPAINSRKQATRLAIEICNWIEEQRNDQ